MFSSAPDILRLLRLAQLRARPLAAGHGAGHVPGHRAGGQHHLGSAEEQAVATSKCDRGICVAVFDAQFTEEKVAREMEYFMRSSEKSYERTYGWAWLLKLQEQLEVVGGGRWAETLRPLASLLVARWAEYQYSTVQYSTIQYSTGGRSTSPTSSTRSVSAPTPAQHSASPSHSTTRGREGTN